MVNLITQVQKETQCAGGLRCSLRDYPYASYTTLSPYQPRQTLSRKPSYTHQDGPLDSGRQDDGPCSRYEHSPYHRSLELTRAQGTTRYFNKPRSLETGRESATALKCDTSGPEPIILVPQPSDDPNDPLVWPDQCAG